MALLVRSARRRAVGLFGHYERERAMMGKGGHVKKKKGDRAQRDRPPSRRGRGLKTRRALSREEERKKCPSKEAKTKHGSQDGGRGRSCRGGPR
jgi:hypothetical protein